VNAIACQAWTVLSYVVNVYTVLLFVYAVLSWIPDLRGRWIYYLSLLIEPVLSPIRRVIPPIGGLDIAFLVLILVLQVLVAPLVRNVAIHACYVGF